MRECVTVFSQTAPNANVKLQPEIVFKGADKRRLRLTPPSGIEYQWALKGSYCSEQLLKMISYLLNRFNMFTHQN